jgi:hypothetical protein
LDGERCWPEVAAVRREPATDGEQWVTQKEAAEPFGCHYDTPRRYRKVGRLGGVPLRGSVKLPFRCRAIRDVSSYEVRHSAIESDLKDKFDIPKSAKVVFGYGDH